MGFSIKMLTEASSRIVYAARVSVKNKKNASNPTRGKNTGRTFVRKKVSSTTATCFTAVSIDRKLKKKSVLPFLNDHLTTNLVLVQARHSSCK